ncbi:hypothetical protein H5187_20935 [Pseudoalteromonas sp. SG44-1]|uniref:hypothetical protein n=1 Tax=Pseudoalteromonas sp. SG44-1 TaxID=2760964 RepID=UPI001604999A|nr:hypothetical protein [Pseudoalteromonas sp. SG44-1]MBB1419711.1 hypothetical protein [Pseudoalteromonas sp. SG44-1]
MFTKLKARVGQKEFDSRMINLALIIAFFMLLLLTFLFAIKFGIGLPADIQTWQNTSSYFQNIIALLTGPLSLLILYFVWKDNRQELAETKKALTEQSDTQNFSVIKDAVFEIADQVTLLLKKNVNVIDRDSSYILENVDNSLQEEEPQNFLDCDWDIDPLTEDIRTIKLEDFVKEYFIHMKSEPFELEEKETQYENVIFTSEFFTFIDKVKTISLFMRSLKGVEYKEVLEIILFSKLTIFTWLLFVEIAFHLLTTAKEGEKETAELVFVEIAGLTCRQLKEANWINALSDEVLLELKERKLL